MYYVSFFNDVFEVILEVVKGLSLGGDWLLRVM